MGIAITLKEFLDGRGVEYDVLQHAPTPTASRAAEASHVPGDCLAKAVVLRRGGDFMLAVVPASCRVNLDRVEELMDERVALATEDEIEGLFRDCDRGAVPPLGSAYGLECIIDETLERPRDIYFEGGDHSSLVHLSQAQFNDLTWDAYHGRIAARAWRP